jgi:hypothetical protein
MLTAPLVLFALTHGGFHDLGQRGDGALLAVAWPAAAATSSVSATPPRTGAGPGMRCLGMPRWEGTNGADDWAWPTAACAPSSTRSTSSGGACGCTTSPSGGKRGPRPLGRAWTHRHQPYRLVPVLPGGLSARGPAGASRTSSQVTRALTLLKRRSLGEDELGRSPSARWPLGRELWAPVRVLGCVSASPDPAGRPRVIVCGQQGQQEDTPCER